MPRRESEALLDRARTALAEILALVPRAAKMHPVTPSREAWLRFRGLPFARWADARVSFGISDVREDLNAASRPAWASPKAGAADSES